MIRILLTVSSFIQQNETVHISTNTPLHSEEFKGTRKLFIRITNNYAVLLGSKEHHRKIVGKICSSCSYKYSEQNINIQYYFVLWQCSMQLQYYLISPTLIKRS
uniref:Uncharacterized protein n=1 Tax=Micrurus lemniscatus lemniscatus TaxID=129467 RepID=A0A2D4HCZ9_MICLE